MSKFGGMLLESVEQAVAIAQGQLPSPKYIEHTLEVVHIPDSVDVKGIRESMGLSQSMFAASFGLSLHAIRNWEQGKRQPDPSARAYLTVIKKAPETVKQALQS